MWTCVRAHTYGKEEIVKKLLEEFKAFIAQGNAMDMAIGVIIGGAFTAIVTSLTDDIINPLITVIAGGGADQLSGLVVPGTSIDFGAFISAIINFLIIAIIVFLLIKGINSMQKVGAKITGHEKPEMTPPTCPFCLEEVKEGATRCPHCAAEFSEPAAPKPVEKEA